LVLVPEKIEKFYEDLKLKGDEKYFETWNEIKKYDKFRKKSKQSIGSPSNNSGEDAENYVMSEKFQNL
jgi:hypothetical protein